MSDTTQGIDTAALADALGEQLAEGMHVGYRHAIDCPQAHPIWTLIRDMPADDWGRYVDYVTQAVLRTVQPHIDTLTARLAAVELELDAARRVVKAARGAVEAGTGRPMTVYECARLMDAVTALTADATEEATDGE